MKTSELRIDRQLCPPGLTNVSGPIRAQDTATIATAAPTVRKISEMLLINAIDGSISAGKCYGTGVKNGQFVCDPVGATSQARVNKESTAEQFLPRKLIDYILLKSFREYVGKSVTKFPLAGNALEGLPRFTVGIVACKWGRLSLVRSTSA